MNDFKSQFPHFLERVNVYCQKVLPLAFDNSLSYYEFLGKINMKLNETIDAINAQNLNIIEFTHMLNLEIEKFEEYMQVRQQNFEEKIEKEFSEFKNEMLTAWENMKNDWEIFKTEMLSAFENLKNDWNIFKTEITEIISNFKDEINKIILDFTTEINENFEIFKTECITNFENFKTEINNTVSEFENQIDKEFSGFKNVVNDEINDFKSEIRLNQTNFENNIIKLFEDWASDEEKHLDEWKSQYYLIWEEWKKGTENYINSEIQFLIKKINEMGYSEYPKISANVENIQDFNSIDVNNSIVISYIYNAETDKYTPFESVNNIQNFDVRYVKTEKFKIFHPFMIDKVIDINKNYTLNFNLNVITESNTLINAYILPSDLHEFTLEEILQFRINPLNFQPMNQESGKIRLSFVCDKKLTGNLFVFLTTSKSLFDQSTENEEFLTVENIDINSERYFGYLNFTETSDNNRYIFYPKIKIDDITIKYNENYELYSTGNTGNVNVLKTGVISNYIEQNGQISSIHNLGDIGNYTIDDLFISTFFNSTTQEYTENLANAQPIASIFVNENNEIILIVKSNPVPAQYGCNWKLYYKLFSIS